METMPYLALIALSVVFAIGSVGVTLGNNGMNSLASSGANPLLQFLVGSIILIALIVLNIVKPRAGFRIISIFWIVGIIALVVSISALLFAGKNGVANYVDSLHIANTTYNSIASSYQNQISIR